MGKQRVLTICQVVGLLGVLSIAASEDSSLVNDIDYGSVQSNILKEKCSDYPEFRPCHYWKSFPEEGSDGDKVLKCQDNCTAPAKDTGKREVLLEVPFLSPERQPFAGSGKRFSVYRRKNPYAQGYKRGPGFRSWGGKRSEAEPEKRTKFTSWGGKRDEPWDYLDSEDKRTKFANWGGKREDNAPDKRTKFRSWGGKRSQDYPEDVSKRDSETPISYDQVEKKFWKNRALYLSEPFKMHVPKRPQFQSWGGKRTLRLWSDPLGLYYPARFNLRRFQNWDEKRKFSSWGGKRGGSDVDLDKRFGQNTRAGKIPNEFKTRQIFQNWGGKRTRQEEEEEGEEDREEDIGDVFGVQVPEGERKKRQNSKTPENFPRSNFNSWGGKRDGEGEGAQR